MEIKFIEKEDIMEEIILDDIEHVNESLIELKRSILNLNDKDEDKMKKYNFIMFTIVNFLYSIFIFIGFIFLINNKINIFNINHFYEEAYKNVLLSLSIFLEILFRLSLNIIIIKGLKKS